MAFTGPVAGSISSEIEARAKIAACARFTDLDPDAKSNLTANQLQVWLAQNLLPDTPIFNLAAGLHFEGLIDVECFRSAFSVLVASSDALRTTVEETDGVPLQRVLPHVSSELDIVDFSHAADPIAAAKGWMERRCRTPLNRRGRLFESALIRLADGCSIWYFNAHHLICDGWSFELIYRTTADLYRLARAGRMPQTIELPRFADYIAYEHAYRKSARYRKTEAYWRSFLADPSERVDFYGRVPGVMTSRVRRISRELGPDRTLKLKAVAKELRDGTGQAALFDIFAAVLIGYLNCLNGNDSYTIGVPFHNRRTGSSFKETIGFFSEVLPVRVSLEEGETFVSLIKKFTGEVRRTLRYGQYAVTNPLFKRVYDVTLNYHTRSFSDFAGIPARPQWFHNGHGDESLAMQVHDFTLAESLVVDFDLHEAVFEGRDCERVVGHYLRVLDAFLEQPEMSLRALSLTSTETTHQLFTQCATAGEETSEQPLVLDLFDQRVQERPDQPAVLSEGESLTYLDLRHRAASIARELRARGIRPGALVVIYLTRSPAMIAAMLGALETGAAYVPVDPQHSREWLKFILEDTGARVLLTERRLLADLPESAGEVICVDETPPSNESIDESSAIICGDDLAYVIYTSGSTGIPKGVEVTHAALANFAKHAAQIFEISSSDRILQFASIGFDTSVEEIFPCLISGAALVLRPNIMASGAAALLDECRARKITILDLPTAYWHELTVELFAARRMVSEPIRLVVIGGERAMPERLGLWQAFVADNVRLLNTYGPTETTVAATFADLTHAPGQCGGAGEVAIGRAIANVQALVLDRNLNPIPEGVPVNFISAAPGLPVVTMGDRT